jgi:hypothetical protein
MLDEKSLHVIAIGANPVININAKTIYTTTANLFLV